MKDSNGQYIPWSLFDAPLKITTDGSSLKERTDCRVPAELCCPILADLLGLSLGELLPPLGDHVGERDEASASTPHVGAFCRWWRSRPTRANRPRHGSN